MANGDVIQKFTKKPKSTKTIDENIEANGNVSVTGDVAVTGTITGNLTGDVTGNADTATHATTADSATNATNATNDSNGDKIDETYFKKTGGSITGNTSITGDHYLRINGSATHSPLRVGGIAGITSDGSAFDTLYLQHSVNKPIYLGNTGAYNISADGGTYSGKASTAGTADTANKIKSNSTNPTSATNYYFTFVSENANSVDLRANTGAYYTTREGTTSQVGQGILRLGNTTASGTAGNKRGYLRICGETAYYSQLQTADGVSANRTIYMPNHNGTIQVRATNLYNNTTGTNGTVTLSASSANYNWLDIYYYKAESAMGGNIYDVVRVYAPNGKLVTLGNSHVATNSVMQTIAKLVSISTTKITVKKEILANFTVGTTSVTECSSPSTTQIHIVRVDGWV